MTYSIDKFTTWAACQEEYDFVEMPEYIQQKAFDAWNDLHDLISSGNADSETWVIYKNLSRNLQI
jgi:hypothetical protein